MVDGLLVSVVLDVDEHFYHKRNGELFGQKTTVDAKGYESSDLGRPVMLWKLRF